MGNHKEAETSSFFFSFLAASLSLTKVIYLVTLSFISWEINKRFFTKKPFQDILVIAQRKVSSWEITNLTILSNTKNLNLSNYLALVVGKLQGLLILRLKIMFYIVLPLAM